MKTIKGPALFLAQFAGDKAPFNTFDGICGWAASIGYEGVQIPAWDGRLFDLAKAAESKTYCDEIMGVAAKHGLAITELATHLQGQLVAVHPAYDEGFDAFAAPHVRGNPKARQEWAVQQMLMAAKASRHLGLDASATFSGALAYPYLYPWPPRPKGLIETAFDELARRWRPILDAYDEVGVDVCYEIHPGEDLLDGTSYEKFLGKVGNHKRACINYDPSHFVLQALDYLQFIDFYHERIKAFHVKDAELNPTGKQGVFSGFADWPERAGRFRSPGDGDVNFGAIFSKLTQYGYGSWAVVEWECCLKAPEQGAAESADLVRSHIIEATTANFEDFAGGGAADEAANRRALGLDR
ncbi:MAG: sugar phosphate isomerase/epimerase [Geminicoccaceae bacterium]